MEGFLPSAEGSIIYLNGADNLNIPLLRVESADRKIVIPKNQIEMKFMAEFRDTEGNRIRSHSMN